VGRKFSKDGTALVPIVSNSEYNWSKEGRTRKNNRNSEEEHEIEEQTEERGRTIRTGVLFSYSLIE
jgi:hypothetical protein